jgi:acyl-coenzyme A synthetase/AMP-(fatty) acid ligase/3-hydroxymyristoyl/3-hydroxydecanoyl-(acyl carrier protein) dehydratase
MIALHDLLRGRRAAHTPVCRDVSRGDAQGQAQDQTQGQTQDRAQGHPSSASKTATTIDHAAFCARVAAIAAHVDKQQGTRCALCIDDTYDFACALFAILACGKNPVIPASATPGYLADLAGAYDSVLTDASVQTLERETSLTSGPASSAENRGRYTHIDPHAPLTLYTSGSSGAPKPILKTLAQFDAEVRTLENQWGDLAGAATVVASVPHRHIYGLLFRVLWPLAAGRPFDRTAVNEPQQLQARIDAYGATVVVSAPAQLSRWPALPGFATLAPVPRAFFSSGGPLAEEAAREYAAAFGGASPVEIYGSTETGGIGWRCQSASTAWQPLVGIDTRRDVDGALELRSPHLGHDDWHRTDDAVSFDATGRFTLQGRLDRIVKLDGKRVSLPELEARLMLHPYVAQAATVPLAGVSRERIGAVIALSEAGSAALRASGRIALAKTLHRHLATYFDTVVLPRRWRFRIALPYDARGKLPATTLAQAFGPRAEGVEVLAEARDGNELHYELRVPPSLVHFDGHFPGVPILPGVVQLDWAIRLASEHVPGVDGLASIDRLKFTAPVRPGALLALTLAHDAPRRRVQFAYRLGERDCASGVIVYREST